MLFEEQQPVQPKPEEIKIHSKDYRHSLVESSLRPHYALYTGVKGTPISGTYYRGFLGKDEEPIGYQPNNYAVYQSYTQIDHMVLKVDGDGSFQYDPEKAESTESMMVYLFFDLTPILGDLFITDIGDGRAGLYQINQTPELKSYAAIKVYYAELKLLGIVDQSVEDNLKSKVVEHFVYSADSIMNGGHAVITREQRDQGARLSQCAYFLAQHMLENFRWEPERTIAIKDAKYGWVYDPQLASFLRDVIPSVMTTGNRNIELLNYQTGTNFGREKRLTIWDVFKQGNFDLLQMVNREYNIYPKNDFFSTRNYLGFDGSKFDYIIVPGKVEYSQLSGRDVYFNGGFNARVNEPRPTPYPYYFTDGFYSKKPGNEWESLLIDFFVNKNIDRERLFYFYEQYPAWDPIDQLYRGGLLLSMMIIARKINKDW